MDISKLTQQLKSQGFNPKEIAGALSEALPEVGRMIQENPHKLNSIIGYDLDNQGVETPAWYANPDTYTGLAGGMARKPIMNAFSKAREFVSNMRGLGSSPSTSATPNYSEVIDIFRKPAYARQGIDPYSKAAVAEDNMWLTLGQ